MATTINITQIIGKTLFAAKTVTVHRLPDPNSEIVATVQPGHTVGVVYSWVTRNGKIWWQFDNFTYAIHEPDLYSLKKLYDQGVIDTSTQNQPSNVERFKALMSKTIDNLGIAIPVIIALIILWLGFKAYKTIK